jgi:hypothetical protein
VTEIQPKRGALEEVLKARCVLPPGQSAGLLTRAMPPFVPSLTSFSFPSVIFQADKKVDPRHLTEKGVDSWWMLYSEKDNRTLDVIFTAPQPSTWSDLLHSSFERRLLQKGVKCLSIWDKFNM